MNAVHHFQRNTLIADILEHPGAAGVLLGFGLPCATCVVAESEPISVGVHLSGIDVDEVLTRLNALPTQGMDAHPG